MMLLDVKATSEKLTSEKAYNAVTTVLVDKGFDVKVADKDIGLVTTEYKKYGSVETYGSPAFDFYLQIKTQIKNRPDGKLQITMTPQVKESNRLNSAGQSYLFKVPLHWCRYFEKVSVACIGAGQNCKPDAYQPTTRSGG